MRDLSSTSSPPIPSPTVDPILNQPEHVATPRLKWQRDLTPETFIAYPHGEDFREVVAKLWLGSPWGQGRPGWHWSFRFHVFATTSGFTYDRKLSLEQVNAAWPAIAAEGARRRDAVMARDRMRYRISRVEARGVLTVEEFEIAAQPHEILLFMVKECRDRWQRRWQIGDDCRAVEELMNAVSAELYRRRTR